MWQYEFMKNTWTMVIVVLGVALIIWVFVAKKDAKEESATLTSREVALQCTTDMATEFHIHPELSIVINGEKQIIPTDVGIVNGCMNALHAHDDKGILHVEAPVKKDFTLGDFFAVWKKDFSKDKILDAVVSENLEIVVTVNGQKVDTYENTILYDKDKILIEYKNK